MFSSTGRRTITSIVWVVTAAVILAAPVFGRCGVERWSVKTGADDEVTAIDLSSATPTTIAALTDSAQFPAPAHWPPSSRIVPAETTLWVVDAFLGLYREENDPASGDTDYHLQIRDAAGNHMIAEIPFPDCAQNSHFLTQITRARAAFDAQFNVTGSFQDANGIPVRITGIAMFDKLAHGGGHSPNGMEIHPVLGIVFNPGPPDSTPLPTVETPSTESSPTPAPDVPTATTTPSDSTDTSVFYNRHGHAYHRADCRFTGPTSLQTTVEEAKQRGLTPCGICKPPE